LAALMIGHHLSISALPLKLSGQGQELSEVRESKHQDRGREAQPEHSPQADNGEIRRDKRAVVVSSSNGAWNAVCIFSDGSHGSLLSVWRSCLPAADRPNSDLSLVLGPTLKQYNCFHENDKGSL
jgi:hypothetical protein